MPLVYERISFIHGWNDVERLIPADLSYEEWEQTQMDCARRQIENFICPTTTATMVEAGSKSRIVSATEPNHIRIEEWRTDVPVKCQMPNERRAVVRPATTDIIRSYGYHDPGEIPEIGRLGCHSSANKNHITLNTVIDVYNDYRYYDHVHHQVGQEVATEPTATVPVSFEGDGRVIDFTSKGTWKSDCETAINAHLTELGFAGFNSNLHENLLDYSGGAVSGGINLLRVSCFTGDTPVLMADGTVKPIASIRAGDVTAAGQVSRTYAREFDPADQLSETGYSTYRGGLYLYRGVYVTGNHAVHEDGRWIEVADSALATPADRHVRTVYNLDVENFIVPVIGADGWIAFFADNLNNVGGAAARGFYGIRLERKVA